jgi:hypothetical protein
MFWKPDDVFEIECPKCGYHVEFFKFDAKRKCRCGHVIVNPRIDFGCAEWCPYGDSCIEGLPEEMKERQRKRNPRLPQQVRPGVVGGRAFLSECAWTPIQDRSAGIDWPPATVPR